MSDTSLDGVDVVLVAIGDTMVTQQANADLEMLDNVLHHTDAVKALAQGHVSEWVQTTGELAAFAARAQEAAAVALLNYNIAQCDKRRQLAAIRIYLGEKQC